MSIHVRPATADRWDDVAALFGRRGGGASSCWCQVFVGCRAGSGGVGASVTRCMRSSPAPSWRRDLSPTSTIIRSAGPGSAVARRFRECSATGRLPECLPADDDAWWVSLLQGRRSPAANRRRSGPVARGGRVRARARRDCSRGASGRRGGTESRAGIRLRHLHGHRRDVHGRRLHRSRPHVPDATSDAARALATASIRRGRASRRMSAAYAGGRSGGPTCRRPSRG